MKTKKEKPDFDIKYKDFRARAWGDYDKKNGDALIEIQKNGKVYKNFMYPAYKIWNVAAHFEDIVEGELKNSDVGYRVAGSDGLGGVTMPQKIEKTKY